MMDHKNIIESIIRKYLNNDENISWNESLTAMGIDSLQLMHIIIDLEDTFHIEIPEEKLMFKNFENINKINDVIESILNDKE